MDTMTGMQTDTQSNTLKNKTLHKINSPIKGAIFIYIRK